MKIRDHLGRRLLSLALCLCMVLGFLPAIAPVIEAEAVNNITPNYITDLGIAYASSQSKAKNLVTDNGFTLIDRDLNQDAGGKWIYMGYKTSTDPSRAITGILFRSGENPPNSVSYGGATFYLVGGSYEGNGTGDGAVDLNEGAGGDYIYTYITRDTNYGYPILWMGAYTTTAIGSFINVPNTSGSAGNVNAGTGDQAIYVEYNTFENIGALGAYTDSDSKVYLSCKYLTASGSGTTANFTGQLKNHLDTYYPSVSARTTVTWSGYSMTLKGWGIGSSVLDAQTQSPYGVYTDNSSSGARKYWTAVYSTDVKVTYDANGGTGVPSAQTQTAKVNGFEYGKKTSFTIPTTKPTNTNGCKYFLGWSTNKNATSAQYTAGQQRVEFKTNTTLYAVWENHHDGDGDKVCDLCQTALTAPTTVNGVYQISNKNQLIWFMQYVNAGNKGANAVLTADIDMGGYNWTPIASTASYHESGAAVTDKGYTGTFDGAGHVIKNFTVSGGAGDGSSGASGNVRSYGLFGTVSGTVKNLGIDGYTFHVGTADCRAGGIVGQLVSSGRIENCYVINSKVLTGTRIAGAIAGCNYGGTIDSCFAYNCEVTGHSRCAAIVGDTKDDGGSKIGSVINCYADKNPVGSQNGGSGYVQNCATLSADQIASGEAAWKLNGNTSDGVWKQTVGTGLPSFSGSTVYQVLRCDGKTITYSNSNVSPQAHNYRSDNLCTFCGTLNPDAVASVSKNGVVTSAYTTLNDAIEAVKDCTADDKAVITLLKDIELGSGYQTINGGIFTIDLNGKTLSNTDETWATLTVINAKLTITDSGSGGAIYSEKRWALEACDSAVLTVNRGDIYGKKDGIHATAGSIVTVNGGSISGDSYGVYADISSKVTIAGGSVSSSYYGANAVVNGKLEITGGTVTGDVGGVYTTSSQTVAILGGTISGDEVGICMGSGSAVEIFGGSISCGQYDIKALGSVRVELFGATFPGGIAVYNTTLNAILSVDAAYWQGDTMIIPADDAYFILGGDVTVKDACQHLGDKTYTNNGADHSYTCSGCNNTLTEAHSYNATTLLCVCGAARSDAVAVVSKNGIVTGAYTTLNGAIKAVASCAADDKAVITLLQNTAMGNSSQYIYSGVFTIDLNGFELGTDSNLCALYIDGSVVTIMDSRTNGKIIGQIAAIEVYDSNLTVISGTMTGKIGIYAEDSILDIEGGTFNGSTTSTTGGGIITHCCDTDILGGEFTGYYGLYSEQYAGMDIKNAVISASGYGVTATTGSDVTISGGSISGNISDIYCDSSNVLLRLDTRGVGATFPDGISVSGTTLNAILGEGAAYWQGNTMILPADGATEITGGDVVIKAECKHPGDKTYTNNGDDHSYTYSCCNNTVTEAHSYDATTLLCVCGAVRSDAVAVVSKNGILTRAYTNLDDALSAVEYAAAEDNAVVKLIQSVDCGDDDAYIDGGVFTLDLNGLDITATGSCTLNVYGDNINMTIIDSGEGGTISNTADTAIQLYYGTLSIDGGTISGNISIDTYDGMVKINGGTITATDNGVYALRGAVIISGGSITSTSSDAIYGYDASITISGGSITSTSSDAIFGSDSAITISGGTISASSYDVFYWDGSLTLELGENGVGATFLNKFQFSGDSMNAVLSEGTAYWQGDKMIVPSDSAYRISGGDVTIKPVCKHPGEKSYTIDGDTHVVNCAICSLTYSEAHSIDPATMQCACGVTASVSVTMGGNTVYYPTLNSAIQAVSTAASEDEAVVKLLNSVDLGDTYQSIQAGVFTLDLNGCSITSTTSFVLYLSSANVDMVITDSGEGGIISGATFGVYASDSTLTINGGTINGDTYGIDVYNGTLTIYGGTISGDAYGVYASDSTLTINGGTISSDSYAVCANNGSVDINGGTLTGANYGLDISNSTLTISGGSISGEASRALKSYKSTVTISGGIFSGTYHIDNMSDSAIRLIVGENGIGATFLGGLRVCRTYLDVIIGEGAAYWQGGKQLTVADDAEEITGGDVTIKAECKHTDVSFTYTNNGTDHSYTYSCCGATVTEAHSYDATTLLCVCGAARSDAVATVSKNGIATGAYTTLNDAIQAVENCTTDDEAVITILQNIALGDSRQRIDSGVFTIDLNGFEISGTNSYWGVFAINGAATNVTIQGTGENSRITGDYICIEMDDNATLIITGGTISGGTTGLHAVSSSTVTVSGGSISADVYGVLSENSTVTVTDGTISGGIIGGGPNEGNIGVYAMDSTVTISGGTISGTVYGMDAVGCTVTISGGAIKGGYSALIARSCGTVTISGGSISGDGCDIVGEQSIITLTLGEDGVGGTFPGGICVYGTTLNAMLGEGVAYWQNGKQLTVADDAKEITGGDVTIKAECTHTDSWLDATCTTPKTCTTCGATEGEALGHSYDSVTQVCRCGKINPNVEATISKNGVITGRYTSIQNAFDAAKSCTAEDRAILTLLGTISFTKSIEITGGVFTFDLNDNGLMGKVSIRDAEVTIIDSGENGRIYRDTVPLALGGNAIVTIAGGTYMSGYRAIYNPVVVQVDGNATLRIIGGKFEGDARGVVVYEDASLYVGGGTFDCPDDLDIRGTATLNGGTFINGILISGMTLRNAMGEGMSYWQGDKMIAPGEEDKEITDGDVVVKATCKHENAEVVETVDPTCTEDGYTTYFCGCGTTFTADVLTALGHSWLDATCTAPKTCSKCGATEGEPTGLHIDENNNGRCDTCNCLMQPAKLVMATMSLEGNIGINYYMLLSDDVINDSTAFMQFTLVDGEVINVPVSEGIPTQVGDEILYLFTCAVNAKEMSDDVLAQCFYEGGSTQVYTYSVKAYCDHILNSSDDEALKDLVKKMLHYGAASQNYFQYNTDDLANAGLEAPNYEGVVIDGFKATAGQGTELSKLYAASLILKSKTTLRFFFNGPITATYNGQALNVGQRSGLYYVDVTGIAAADLDEDIVITINDGANTADIVFNPMAYCQGVYNNSDDAQLVELVTALYVYNQAANNYFEEV